MLTIASFSRVLLVSADQSRLLVRIFTVWWEHKEPELKEVDDWEYFRILLLKIFRIQSNIELYSRNIKSSRNSALTNEKSNIPPMSFLASCLSNSNENTKVKLSEKLIKLILKSREWKIYCIKESISLLQEITATKDSSLKLKIYWNFYTK